MSRLKFYFLDVKTVMTQIKSVLPQTRLNCQMMILTRISCMETISLWMRKQGQGSQATLCRHQLSEEMKA